MQGVEGNMETAETELTEYVWLLELMGVDAFTTLNYTAMLTQMQRLPEVVEAFFATCRVDDPEHGERRRALLRRLDACGRRICDWTKVEKIPVNLSMRGVDYIDQLRGVFTRVAKVI